MALIKTNLDKFNFSKLYKIQMKNSTFKSKSSSDWDKKALHFSQNVLNSPYTKKFTKRVDTSVVKLYLMLEADLQLSL